MFRVNKELLLLSLFLFKLLSLKGKSNADKTLVCHGLPLFKEWGNLREKEEPIGCGSFALVVVTRNANGEKVVSGT